MVLWVLVLLLLLVMGHVVDAHKAVIAASLGVSHGSGGEVGRRHHDGGLHALLPHLAGAALLWSKRKPPVYIYNPSSAIPPWLLILDWALFCWMNDIPNAQDQWLWQHRHDCHFLFGFVLKYESTQKSVAMPTDSLYQNLNKSVAVFSL